MKTLHHLITAAAIRLTGDEDEIEEDTGLGPRPDQNTRLRAIAREIDNVAELLLRWPDPDDSGAEVPHDAARLARRIATAIRMEALLVRAADLEPRDITEPGRLAVDGSDDERTRLFCLHCGKPEDEHYGDSRLCMGRSGTFTTWTPISHATNPAPSPKVRCSFCGKARESVRHMAIGPSVQICDECVTLCRDLMGPDHASGPADEASTVPSGLTGPAPEHRTTTIVSEGHAESWLDAIIYAIDTGRQDLAAERRHRFIKSIGQLLLDNARAP